MVDSLASLAIWRALDIPDTPPVTVNRPLTRTHLASLLVDYHVRRVSSSKIAALPNMTQLRVGPETHHNRYNRYPTH